MNLSVVVGGTGTGRTRLAIAIARSCIRAGARGRFYNVVDLVNRLEFETRNGRQRRLAEHLIRMDFIVLDELGYLPLAQSGGQLLFHLVRSLYERACVIVTTNSKGLACCSQLQAVPAVDDFDKAGSGATLRTSTCAAVATA
jgi:DNA replication protein DnaC